VVDFDFLHTHTQHTSGPYTIPDHHSRELSAG
jgi:hypothetical protein